MSELFSDAILEFHHESAPNCNSKPTCKQGFFKVILNKAQHIRIYLFQYNYYYLIDDFHQEREEKNPF